ATHDCDWARVTGTGTRQRKRERDGFLYNSCYLHGTCVLSLPSLLPLIFLLLQLPRSKTRRACGRTHVHFSAVPSGWSTLRQQAKSEERRAKRRGGRTHTVPRQPQRAPTPYVLSSSLPFPSLPSHLWPSLGSESGAACRRVDVDTQLGRKRNLRRIRTTSQAFKILKDKKDR
ncbi:hypothetical protein DFH08DRAFT_899677, partial [Mycena albidolilacea]